MNWGVMDFAIAGVLVAGLVVGGIFAAKKAKTTHQRLLLWAGLAVVGILVWGELAVGLFGTPFAGD